MWIRRSPVRAGALVPSLLRIKIERLQRLGRLGVEDADDAVLSDQYCSAPDDAVADDAHALRHLIGPGRDKNRRGVGSQADDKQRDDGYHAANHHHHQKRHKPAQQGQVRGQVGLRARRFRSVLHV